MLFRGDVGRRFAAEFFGVEVDGDEAEVGDGRGPRQGGGGGAALPH